MIFVFAGHKGSHARAIETLIGSCATVEEAAAGVEDWAKQVRAEWAELLAKHHPKSSAGYSQAIVAHPHFWFQFAELRGDDLVVIKEGEV